MPDSYATEVMLKILQGITKHNHIYIYLHICDYIVMVHNITVL